MHKVKRKCTNSCCEIALFHLRIYITAIQGLVPGIDKNFALRYHNHRPILWVPRGKQPEHEFSPRSTQLVGSMCL